MIQLVRERNNPNTAQYMWTAWCEYCNAELKFACMSPAYCITCHNEQPQFHELLYKVPDFRIKYHFKGDLS